MKNATLWQGKNKMHEKYTLYLCRTASLKCQSFVSLVRNKLADVQWNKRDLLFILRPTRRGPVDSVEFVVKKKKKKEGEKEKKGKRKLGGAVSNLARTFSIPKAKGLGLSVGEVDQKFLAHVRGDFKWKGRVVNFVIRRIPRALARCSFRFTGPNFSSLTR